MGVYDLVRDKTQSPDIRLLGQSQRVRLVFRVKEPGIVSYGTGTSVSFLRDQSVRFIDIRINVPIRPRQRCVPVVDFLNHSLTIARSKSLSNGVSRSSF